MQLAGQAIALLDDGVFARLLVQPRVLDGRRRLIGEKRGQISITVGEAAQILALLKQRAARDAESGIWGSYTFGRIESSASDTSIVTASVTSRSRGRSSSVSPPAI